MASDRTRERLRSLGEIGGYAVLFRIALSVQEFVDHDGDGDEDGSSGRSPWLLVGVADGLLRRRLSDRGSARRRERVALGLIAFLREYRQAGDRDRLAGMAWATRFLAGHSLAAIGYRLWYGVIRPRPDPE